MKKLFVAILTVTALSGAGAAEAIRIVLESDFINENSSATVVGFRGEILIPQDGKREIFIAPYTLTINSGKQPSGKYNLKIDFAGLGPTFARFSRDFELAPGENMLISSLPAKNDVVVNYGVSLSDDTSSIVGYAFSPDDSLEWGTSVTIHYSTRWLKNSYADFTWNRKMGYLENIYDRSRSSFRLSMSERINITFYPEPTDAVYLDPRNHYAIYPNTNEIDIVYGHDIDAADPAPGAELLIYRLWGYGPRWMAAGLARYYDDNNLILSELVGKLDRTTINKKIGTEDWVVSDTGSIFCGGFVNWLLINFSQSNFQNLYRKSTPLDFENNFKEIYQLDFKTALGNYIVFLGNYKPTKGELIYYSLLNLEHNNFGHAERLYALLSVTGDNKEDALDKLALCRLWTGDFKKALDTYDALLSLSPDSSRYMMLKADVLMALGKFKKGYALYEKAFLKYGNSASGLRLVTILIDRGQIDSARAIFGKLDDNIKGKFSYFNENARLKMAFGESDLDSTLNQMVARALNVMVTAQDDPRGYLAAGRAYAMLGQFDKASENLKTAHFLERKSSILGVHLLELGRAADLNGKRDEAIDYYRQAAESGAGAYIESLCEKYIKSPYRLKN